MDNKNGIQKEFENNVEKLNKLFNTQDINSLAFIKISANDIPSIIKEVIEENYEESLAKFKEQAKDIIREKIEYDKFVKTEKVKFDKLVDEATKKFNERVKKLISEIDDFSNVNNFISEGNVS